MRVLGKHCEPDTLPVRQVGDFGCRVLLAFILIFSICFGSAAISAEATSDDDWTWNKPALTWLNNPENAQLSQVAEDDSDGHFSQAYQYIGNRFEDLSNAAMKEIITIMPGVKRDLDWHRPEGYLRESTEKNLGKKIWYFGHRYTSDDNATGNVSWFDVGRDEAFVSSISLQIFGKSTSDTQDFFTEGKNFFASGVWTPRKKGDFFDSIAHSVGGAVNDGNWAERTGFVPEPIKDLQDWVDRQEEVPDIYHYEQIVNRDIVSFPEATAALISWNVNSRLASINWRRGVHMVTLSAVAPSVSDAKSHLMRIAAKVDAVLDAHRFYDFPYAVGMGLEWEIKAFDLLDANPQYLQKLAKLAQTQDSVTPNIWQPANAENADRDNSVSILRAGLLNPIEITDLLGGEISLNFDGSTPHSAGVTRTPAQHEIFMASSKTAGWSAPTLKLLQSPQLMVTDEYFSANANWGPVVDEVSGKFEALTKPMTVEIESLIADLGLGLTLSHFRSVDLDPNRKTPGAGWSIAHDVRSREQEEFEYGTRPRRVTMRSKFEFRSKILINSDPKNFLEHFEIYGNAPDPESEEEGVPNAETGQISIGSSDRAQVSWDDENKYVSVNWYRGEHLLSIGLFAPDAASPRGYAVGIARKIDLLLEEYGFFDFPGNIAVATAEQDVPDWEVKEFDLLDANPQYLQNLAKLAQIRNPLTQHNWQFSEVENFDRNGAVSFLPASLLDDLSDPFKIAEPLNSYLSLSSDSIAPRSGEALRVPDQLEFLVAADETLALHDPDGISPNTLKLLQSPELIETESYSFGGDLWNAAVSEVMDQYRALSEPMMLEIEGLVAGQGMTFNHSPYAIDVRLDQIAGAPHWALHHGTNTQEERSFEWNAIHSTGWNFSFNSEIFVGADQNIILDEVKNYVSGRVEPEQQGQYTGFMDSDNDTKNPSPEPKDDGGGVRIANSDIISIGSSDHALVTWNDKSNYVRVRWHRGKRLLRMSLFAPDVAGARNYAVGIAGKVDSVLEKHGFFDFPGNIAVAAVEQNDTEIVLADYIDANPIFAQDTTSLPQTLRPSQLIRAKTTRKGTSADGVSQLILRAQVSDEAAVSFKLVGANDGKIEPLLDGKTVTLDKKHYAFALYTPPEVFDVAGSGGAGSLSPLQPPEKRLGDILQVRDVAIIIEPEDGNATSKTIILAQPPVVLVHGLFSDPIQTWVSTFDDGASMAGLLERAGFLPFLVNYQNSNGMELVNESWLGANKFPLVPSSFENNKRVVWDSPQVDYEPFAYEYGSDKANTILSELQKPKGTRIGGIKQSLTYYRDELDIAATQAIVIGHSMGGLLARVWASENYNPDYRRPENFQQGDIDRLITLNTPHFGSELMELKDALGKAEIAGESWSKWAKRQMVNTAVSWYLDPEPEAMRDLRPQSEALLKIGETVLPAYAIATSATSAEMGAKKNDPWKAYEALYSLAGMVFFDNRPLLDDFVDDRFELWQTGAGETDAKAYDEANNTPNADDPALDISVEKNRTEFKRIITQNIDHNVEYWVARREADYQDDLKKTVKNTLIAPYGTFSTNMGKATQFLSGSFGSYMTSNKDLDLLSPEVLLSKAITGIDVSRFFDGTKASDVPDTFLSILRDLVFHQDPNTDAVVRVVSQAGNIAGSAQKIIPSVIHSYSSWDYRVQREVLFLLKKNIGAFSAKGFPAAGQSTPRYMPSAKYAAQRVSGRDAIAWSGMVPSHAEEYLRIADAENVFILSRPVNASSTQLLANCNPELDRMNFCAAAKGMNVKGKSASWGPQVGYIPVQQGYSKLWRAVKDPAQRVLQIEKYNGEVKKSLTKAHPKKAGRTYAVERSLSVLSVSGTCDVVTSPGASDAVTGAFLSRDAESDVFLSCGGTIYRWQNSTENGRDIFDPEAPLSAVSGLDDATKQGLVNNPMMVLADDTSDLALGEDAKGNPIRPYLTADYDLLAIGFPFETAQCNGDSCQPSPTLGVRNAEFDSLLGFISPRQQKLVEKMNSAVATHARYGGGLVTHHGPENQYPGSPYVDYPVLVFDPAGEDRALAYLIRQGPPGFRDIHLKRFFTEKNRAGYNLWPNPISKGWQWEARRPFDMARGYDPRDADNLPAYVDEAPKPQGDSSLSTRGEGAVKSDVDQMAASEPTQEKAEPPEGKESQPEAEATPQETKFWTAMKGLGDIDGINLYLQKYPQGSYEKEARALLAELENPAAPQTSGRTELADICDRLAASPDDFYNKTAHWVDDLNLGDQRDEAVDACRAAVEQNPDDLQSKYQLARSLRAFGYELDGNEVAQKARSIEALPLLEELAKENYSTAMIELSGVYQKVVPGSALVIALLEQAYELGNPEAVFQLGQAYWYGDLAERDVGKAMGYLRQPTDWGQPLVRFFSGVWPIESERNGEPLYNEFALKTIELDLAKFKIPAMIALAQIYETGGAKPVDLPKALDLYNFAVEEGYEAAEADVARLIALGVSIGPNSSVPPDAEPQQSEVETSPAEVTNACDTLAGRLDDHEAGYFSRGYLYIRPLQAIPACRDAVSDFPDVARFAFQLGRSLDARGPSDTDEAMKYYRQAVKNGHLAATYNLAELIRFSDYGNEELEAQALSLHSQAGEAGYAASMAKMAALGREKNGVEWAVGWQVKAAEKGNASAMEALGFAYKHGDGIEKSLEKSFEWYAKSAELGSVFAMAQLGEAYAEGLGTDQSDALSEYWISRSSAESFDFDFLEGMLRDDAGREGASKNPRAAAESFVGGLSAKLGRIADLHFNRVLDAKAQMFSEEFRVEVQKSLALRGYYSGDIDGEFGQATRRAIVELGDIRPIAAIPDEKNFGNVSIKRRIFDRAEFFTDADITEIQNAISGVESRFILRIQVEKRIDDDVIAKRADDLFSRSGLADLEKRNGILLLISSESRKYEFRVGPESNVSAAAVRQMMAGEVTDLLRAGEPKEAMLIFLAGLSEKNLQGLSEKSQKLSWSSVVIVNLSEATLQIEVQSQTDWAEVEKFSISPLSERSVGMPVGFVTISAYVDYAGETKRYTESIRLQRGQATEFRIAPRHFGVPSLENGG